jgi:hypothetical protein
LQKVAGNSAVAARLSRLGRRPAGPGGTPGRLVSVSRYEAGEHAQFAGTEVVEVNGVQIPKGNLIAMADFYGDSLAMQTATAEELRRLNALIERDKQARLHVPGVTAPTNEEIDRATGGRYMELNKRNEGHFAPPQDPAAAAASAAAGGDHKALWERYHRGALDQAHEAATYGDTPSQDAPGGPHDAGVSLPGGVGPPVPAGVPVGGGATQRGLVPQPAVVSNMFAAHYLTDAFAAGHLVNKAAVTGQARQAWDRMHTEGWLFKENSFTQAVAARVLADPGVQAALRGQELKIVTWGEITPQRFSELLYLMSSFEGETFFNLFARIVHDKLNEQGVMVENGKGQTWLLSGDTTLNAQSLAIGQQAVAESERNLEHAATTPGALDYDNLFARVWAYVPRPTAAGAQSIDRIRQQFTDAADPATVDAVVALSIVEIHVAIAELIKAGLLRPKRRAAALGTAELPDAGAATYRDAGASTHRDTGEPLPGGVPTSL